MVPPHKYRDLFCSFLGVKGCVDLFFCVVGCGGSAAVGTGADMSKQGFVNGGDTADDGVGEHRRYFYRMARNSLPNPFLFLTGTPCIFYLDIPSNYLIFPLFDTVYRYVSNMDSIGHIFLWIKEN